LCITRFLLTEKLDEEEKGEGEEEEEKKRKKTI